LRFLGRPSQRPERFRRNRNVARAARFQIFEVLNRRVEQLAAVFGHAFIVAARRRSSKLFVCIWVHNPRSSTGHSTSPWAGDILGGKLNAGVAIHLIGCNG
jgi:hypothetical protein